MHDRIIFALDVSDIRSAHTWAERLSSKVGWFKIGLELFTAVGPDVIMVAKDSGLRCFLDLKFHDIPNTVSGAVRSAVRLGADMMTVHISGGTDMMMAAADAAEEESAKLGLKKPAIVGVSVLTSLDQQDLQDMGIQRTLSDQVANMAGMAAKCRLDGMVCSPADLPAVREVVPKDFKVVTPGIRPAWSVKGDQKRVTSPKTAIEDGADLLVIGRPISGSPDPDEAIERIVSEMDSALITTQVS